MIAAPLRARGVILGVADLLAVAGAHAVRPAGGPLGRRGARRPRRRLHRQRPPLHPRARARPDPAAQPAAARACPSRRRWTSPTATCPRHGAGVGGDWFDVIPLSGARVAPGRRRRRRPRHARRRHHGPAAHRRAHPRRRSTCRRTSCSPTSTTWSPGWTTRRARRRGGAGGIGDLGATCLYAVYDPVSRRCAMARAGHPPPALVAPDGTRRLPRPARRAAAGPGRPAVRGHRDRAARGQPPGPVHRRPGRGPRPGHRRRAGPAAPRRSPTAGRRLDEHCATAVLDATAARPARRRHRPAAGPHPALRRRPRRRLGPARRPGGRRRGPRPPAAAADAWGLDEPASPPNWSSANWSPTPSATAPRPIQLRLIRDRTLICEVSDGSSTSPHLRRARHRRGRPRTLPGRPARRALGHPLHARGQDHLGRAATARAAVRVHSPSEAAGSAVAGCGSRGRGSSGRRRLCACATRS